MNKEAEHSDDIARKLEALIPKSLDDIVRAHRDQARLRLAGGEEIMELYCEIRPGQVKDRLEDWRFIALQLLEAGEVQVMLLGNKASDGQARITSLVRQVDLDRQLVVTQSGSLYQLGKPGKGEPPFEHLILVCAAFHNWGFGHYLGVPCFFY